jgi:tetratricopeptide (TPR) repeat protein
VSQYSSFHLGRRAAALQSQGDLSLTHRKFREASEHYSRAMQTAVVGSELYLKVRDKLESVTQILTMESALLYSEKGEEAMKQGAYVQARELFSQALKLNPEFLHLHAIVGGIDRTVQVHGAAARIAEAQQAMKTFKFKAANQLLREAVALNPDKLPSVQPLLDSLVPLMKSEEAIVRHRAGQAAMEEKRYSDALLLFSEAILLLPEPSNEMAVFLSDRALAHYELKDYSAAVGSCDSALALQPDLALAHYRLGMAQFGLDLYDEASSSYEKALRHDGSLAELVKVKQRQVFTAREVQQRREREAERVRQQEAQRKLLEEKRLRDEAAKKEKAEKLAAEKAERLRVKDEKASQSKDATKDGPQDKDRDKEYEKERLRLEKAEKEALRATERCHLFTISVTTFAHAYEQGAGESREGKRARPAQAGEGESQTRGA